MPTLNWFINDSGLKNIKLLAAKNKKNSIITSVNVLDNPDVIKWFKRNELILTTGFVFKERPELIRSSIQKLKHTGCCALGIKVPRFFRTVPENLLEIAEKYEFPILELPYFYSFSEIMHCVFHQIDVETEQNHISENNYTNRFQGFLHFLLYKKHYDQAKLHELCTFYGFPYQKSWICMTIVINDLPIKHKAEILSILKNIVDSFSLNDRQVLTYTDINIFCIFFIFPVDFHPVKAIQSVKHLSSILSSRLKHITSINLPMGYSTCQQTLNGIQTAFEESLAAISLQEQSGKTGPASYLDLLPLKLTRTMPMSDQQSLITNLLQPIINYDTLNQTNLKKTLTIYLANQGNVSAAAKKLFLHRNTMINRINKIKELLSLSLDNSQELLLLQLALLASATTSLTDET